MAIDLPREITLKILYDINENGAYSNISINKYLEGYELREVDRGFITELAYGAVKWRLTIDFIITQFSSVKIKKISPWILNILRLGVYQLLYTDKIPESAACNESVKLAKKYGHEASSRYVNGVLRGIARNKDNIKYPDRDKEYLRYMSVKYSHPEWLVQKWTSTFGKGFTEGLLEANNSVPDFSVRVNTLKVSRLQLIETFKQGGMDVSEGRYVEEAIIIRNPSSISRMDAFQNGYFQVQDESSMLVARILDPQPDELVIDVCSAPGGKSTHIAQLMQNKGTVIARDIHQHKIKLIDDAAKRLGLDIVRTEIFDATAIDENYIGKADRVLVDAPCTGYGIIRRKPDIKWARSGGDEKEITSLQAKILECASKYVKSGGTLVYSTCTIEPRENEDMVKAFVSNSEFQLVDISTLLPSGLFKGSACEGYIQLFPSVDGVDGFFIAKMVKRS